MTRIVVLCLCAAALAVANPIIGTMLNEFGFDSDGSGWVELHIEPYAGGVDMYNWLLVTSTSACTFHYTLPYNGFLIVDSASLIRGLYGRGTFRLNPAGDSIRLVPDSVHAGLADEVQFPALPAEHGKAPMPPVGGSSSVLDLQLRWWQSINWYVDSTPTRGRENDDYSTVAGIVTWAPERNFYFVDVTLSGPTGKVCSGVGTSGESYQAPGLSAGRYAATAQGWPSGAQASYPESIDLGYSATAYGINIEFDPSGMEERPARATDRFLRVATVVQGSLSLPQGLPVARYALVAVDGRKVLDLHPGANDVSGLRAGVYFVRTETPSYTESRKLILTE